ncbi:hypothetical protein DYBT9623_02175 [Dyadobacter sp. CECT 9623]|uniref:Uncharacterized protein n=1 Tax=Dyadobacter linearis TaxID=2823330 RepID=A0ABM8UPQ4_9BACT|nr:hypothetical protein DYBT9623_02175 [Dyadobacter sp. CECT 9623]
MEKSGSSGQELPGKKKRNFTTKSAKTFFVQDIPKNVRLRDFDQILQSDLSALCLLSRHKKIELKDMQTT